MELLSILVDKVGDYTNVVAFKVDGASLLSPKEGSDAAELRKEVGSKKLPVFKYYKNVQASAKKQEAGYYPIKCSE